jgi:eukaryotic-like serine/threonine-protein kinase
MYKAAESPEVTFGDRYLIQRTVADREGMAAMIGFDQKSEQEVFVKSRNPDLDENAVMRISREADVLASLQHRQIPELIDANTDTEWPYIVTELKPRDSKVAEGFELNPRPDFAAELCVAALAPLKYAHEKGFTHRDVKPDNLLMTWAGDVALSDWEIALCRDKELAREIYTDPRHSDWRVTKFGNVWGTLEYMSPEQTRGRSAVPDGRSDLYSLAVTLHLFLNGKLPKTGRTPNEQTVNEVISGDYNPMHRPVPKALREIVERGLQESPEDRYQSAAEMSEDLERYLHPASTLLRAA